MAQQARRILITRSIYRGAEDAKACRRGRGRNRGSGGETASGVLTFFASRSRAGDGRRPRAVFVI
ncbi:hypothetical protein DAI22_11g202200 [Oryza sativa Japonica Group]|nr:hypothetical protein DAI22_11g202200 [Oryza sativa Japonica Group]